MVESSCGQKVRLVFPLTYMNDSGRVVPKVVSPSDSVLVICDQMDCRQVGCVSGPRERPAQGTTA